MSPTIAEFFFRTPHSDIGDFAFGDQGASPLEPDRQGAGAGYESRERRTAFPSEGGRLCWRQAGEYLSGTPLRSAQSLLFCRL